MQPGMAPPQPYGSYNGQPNGLYSSYNGQVPPQGIQQPVPMYTGGPAQHNGGPVSYDGSMPAINVQQAMGASQPPLANQNAMRLAYQRKVLEQWRNPHVKEVERWTKEMVGIWLEFNGFEKHVASKFQNNDVDGHILLRLTETQVKHIAMRQHYYGGGECDAETKKELARSTAFADTIRVWDQVLLIQRLCKKMHTRSLKVPSLGERIVQLGTFRWADTSEGKSITDLKNEVTSAAGSVAMVSTLVWAMCWDIFYNSSVDTFCLSSDPTQCYASGGFDLAGSPLSVFYASAGICAMCFLFSTLFAVFQMIMVNEMSDEVEIEEFLELLGDDVNLAGKLLFLGILFMACPITTYMVANNKLGVYWTTKDADNRPEVDIVFGWLTCFCVFSMALATLFTLFPKFVADLYQSKVDAVKEDLDAVKYHEPPPLAQHLQPFKLQ